MSTVDQNLIDLVDQRIRLSTARTRAAGTCVTRATTGPAADVIYDGSTVAMPVKVLGSVFLRPGDRCVLDLYGTDWVVTGSFTAQGFGESSKQSFGPVAGTGSLSSSTFLDLSEIGPMIFDKAFDNTYVRMALSASAYITSGTPPAMVQFGFRVTPVDANGYTATDHSLTSILLDSATGHASGYYSVRATGLPAGRYSIQLRWRRSSGTALIKVDGNDVFSLEVDEGVRAVNPVL